MTPYELLMLRCKRLGGFHPDTEFKNVGDIWQEIYKRGRNHREPAAELIVGYLCEFIDSQYAAAAPLQKEEKK